MSLDTLVSLGSLLAVGLAIYAAMRGFRTEIRAEIAKSRTELMAAVTATRADLAETRAELKNDIAESRSEVKADISRLDERTFLLAAGLRPRLARPAD